MVWGSHTSSEQCMRQTRPISAFSMTMVSVIPCAYDPKEPHATLRPKVPKLMHGRANARLEPSHNEISAKGLAFKAKQCHVRLHRFFARELVAELGFAQLENSSEQTLEDLAFAQANLQ